MLIGGLSVAGWGIGVLRSVETSGRDWTDGNLSRGRKNLVKRKLTMVRKLMRRMTLRRMDRKWRRSRRIQTPTYSFLRRFRSLYYCICNSILRFPHQKHQHLLQFHNLQSASEFVGEGDGIPLVAVEWYFLQ